MRKTFGIQRSKIGIDGRQDDPITCAVDEQKHPTAILRPSGAAELLGVEEKTLANWRWRGVGPAFLKFPGRGGKGSVRYDRATVLQWLGEQSRASTSDNGNGGGAHA